MTKTARDLRSAAHALRTAANALDETVTALRALSDDLNVPDPEPEPAWPTAPYVWWDGYLWEVTGGGGRYVSVVASIHSPDLTNRDSKTREKATRFAREAVPVTPVPTEAWETWKRATRDLDYTPDCELIDAVDSLAQEVAR